MPSSAIRPDLRATEIGLKTFCSKHIDPRSADSVWMESQMRSHALRAFESRQGGLRDLANPENLQ
jgi:hypothetical protein